MMFTDERIKELIDMGVLEIIGKDEDGDDIIVITDKAENVEPELFTFRQDFLGLAAMQLWDLGVINIFMENETFMVELTPAAYQNQIIAELPAGLQSSLLQFKHILKG